MVPAGGDRVTLIEARASRTAMPNMAGALARLASAADAHRLETTSCDRGLPAWR